MVTTRTNGAAKATNGEAELGAKRPVERDRDEKVSAKRSKLLEKTDYTRWRLLDDEGRQTWQYLEDDEQMKKWPQSIADKYFLGMPTVRTLRRN